MSPTPAERLPIVEEVVATLTRASGAGQGGATALRASMRRATDQFDERAAAALARALVDALCKSPDDVRVLETLVILGLAHPGALTQHCISLETEGRRLAQLLEAAGQFERAYCLGELISQRAPPEAAAPASEQAREVERLLHDAEFAAARGQMETALRCLQEAQHLDPGCGDIPRRMRELRRRQEFRKANAVRRLKLAFVLVIATGGITTVGVREGRIWSAWKSLPPAAQDDVQAMRERLAGIEDLIARERVWISMPAALLEGDVLRHAIELRSRPVEPVQTDAPADATPDPAADALARAEEARLSGLGNAQNGRVAMAITDLKRALEIAPADWPHRERVQANLAALEAWRGKGR